MKYLLIYTAAMAATLALYNIVQPISLSYDAPIMMIAQQQVGTPAMPMAQAQKLAAQYQAQAAAIERSEGVQP